jgi:hypothetical protein
MSDILLTAGAVLSKTRFAWSIPVKQHARALPIHPAFPTLDGQLIMNKKTHSTHDVPGTPPGDYAQDHNKAPHRSETQVHQSQRTPGSRSDRDDHLGGNNQSRRRQTGPRHGG